MQDEPACRACGGATALAKVQSGNQDLRVVIAGKPDGFLGVVPWTASGLRARVCRACGHVDLVAKDLTDLLPGG